jgi:tetratricopeptide (TPR) repeat protein
MDIFRRTGLGSCFLLFILSSGIQAQENRLRLPAPFVPRRPVSLQDMNHREALELYGIGMWCVENNRLLEAVDHLENAAKLEPAAAPIAKALIPLYLALDRAEDALAACKNHLKSNPDDYDIWHLYAGQLKGQGRMEEAIAAMTRAAACPSSPGHSHQFAQIWFDLGILQESAGNWQAAETAFRNAQQILTEERRTVLQEGQINAAQLDTETAKTWEWIGKVCQEAKGYARAADAYSRAQKIIRSQLADPDRALQLDRTLAEIHLEMGEKDKARTKLEEYLKSQPPGSEAYELEIKILTLLGETAAIVPALEKYAGLDRHNVSLQLLLARRYTEEKHGQKAKAIYRELAKDNVSPEVYRGLFNLHKDLGEIDEVLMSLDGSLAKAKGKDKEPGDPAAAAQARAMIAAIGDDGELVTQLIRKAKSRLEDQQPLEFATWRLCAALAARAGQLKPAEAFFRACLEPRASPAIEGDIYVGLIQVLWLEHKYQAIVDDCRQGLKESQAVHFGFFHYHLARALAQLGRIDEALEEVDKTIALAGDGDRLQPRLLRARVLSLGDRHEKAIEECTALLKEATKPEDRHEIRYLLSGILTAAHDLAQAEEQLRLILQDSPDDAGAHNDLGYILADQGKNLAEAEDLIRKALALDREQKQKQTKVGPHDDKDNAAFVDSLGWVLFRRGKLEEAKQELEKALTLPEQGDQGADDPVIWDHLGDVYFRLDDKAKARTLWKKAVTLYEVEKRRKHDDQYQALKHKLKLLESP